MSRRKNIIDMIDGYGSTPKEIADFLGVDEKVIYSDLKHIKKSLENQQKELLVKKPECKKCGFKEFENILNNPTKCPNCRNQNIQSPILKIE